jgi:hypothetical protein
MILLRIKRSGLAKIALVLVRFNHVARFIVNTNHGEEKSVSQADSLVKTNRREMRTACSGVVCRCVSISDSARRNVCFAV